MQALKKRVYEEVVGIEGVKCGALRKAEKEFVKDLNKLKKRCIRDEKIVAKKKEKLEKAREAVAKLMREIETVEEKITEYGKNKEKMVGLIEDIGMEVEQCERRLMHQAKPIIEQEAGRLGIHIESNGECSVCMSDWPWVFNACISKSCKYVICMKCYEKCNGKCPNCRKRFIK